MNVRLQLLAGMLAALIALPALAQTSPPATAQPQAPAAAAPAAEQPKASTEQLTPPADMQQLLMRESQDLIESGIAQRKTEQRLRDAAVDQAIREDRHFMLTLERQATLDGLLTVLVLAIVGMGLWMSYLQISASVAATSLKISKDGLELSSSIVGLFVLLASMFFFYIFMERVYEIRVAPRGEPAAKTGSAKPSD